MQKYIIIIFCSLFCTVLYSQTSLEKYLPTNYVKDGSVDYTIYLQKGLDNHLNIQFPDFPVLINEKGLNIRSNQILNFPKNACLIMKPNKEERYGILNLINVKNVVINNANLKGDREKHIGNSGEWGMGINILSSSEIKIINPIISDCWGDGIYIGEILHKERKKHKTKDFFCQNICIEGGVINNNRRNGVSIISVKGLKIEKLTVENTKGTLPMAGICIEPNNNEQFLENIVLKNIITRNNSEVGIKYVASNFLGKRNKNVSITIDNYKDYGSKLGLYLGGARSSHGKETKKLDGNIKIDGLNLSENEIPIRYGSIQRFNPEISINKLEITGNNKRLRSKEKTIVLELNKKGIKTTN